MWGNRWDRVAICFIQKLFQLPVSSLPFWIPAVAIVVVHIPMLGLVKGDDRAMIDD